MTMESKKTVDFIFDILHKKRLRKLGFIVPVGEKSAQKAAKLNSELPSVSDVAKADDIELQEIVKSTEDLIAKGQETLPIASFWG